MCAGDDYCLKRLCVYALVLIKKRRSWLKYINDDDIHTHLRKLDVETLIRLPRILDIIIKLDVFDINTLDSTTGLMNTYGCLLPKIKQKQL